MNVRLSWLWVLWAAFARAQDAVPAFVHDSLDAYVERALMEWNVPGCAVGIVKNGEILVAKGYGVRDVATGIPVDEHTSFMIASNTKAVTGMTLARLEGEGKLRLDDPAVKWLPWFRLYKKEWTNLVTLKDLVSHRIGLNTFQGDFCHWATSTSREEVIKKLRCLEPPNDFRDRFGYCNAGYNVAGEVIRLASGKTWEDYLSTQYFKPMGLDDTRPLTKDFALNNNHCHPHSQYFGKLERLDIPNLDNLAPATSMVTSVHDWSRWVRMLLANGLDQGRQILPADAIRKSMEPVSVAGPVRHRFNRGQFALYGLGWYLNDYEGYRLVSHTGGADGFVTSVSLIPELGLGVLVFTNTDNNALYQAIKWEIIDAFLGLPYRNYAGSYLARAKERWISEGKWLSELRDSVTRSVPPSLPLRAYAGKYAHPAYGKMQIALEGERLIMRLEHHPGQSARLEHIGADRFLCTYSNKTLGIVVAPFTLDRRKKRVLSVEISCADFVDQYRYHFVRK
ncbi:MAG: serine hydrolase [Saprospiraceae bacterium]|nr:serine hydrolase [Saprospiraceae bacterium]